ncbi:MAG: acyl carrier protein [Polyangiales bacterium]
MNREQIFAEMARTLVDRFEVDPDAVRLDARLYEDLELDSIDAIDMAVKVKEMTGRRVEERELRKIRTVADLVDLVAKNLQGAT